MNKKQKKFFFRIIIASVLMVILYFVPAGGFVKFALYMLPYFIIGYDILKKAALGVYNRQIFDENFLMAIATVGAIVIALSGSGDYTEAVAVMLFYQIGELFQSYAVGKSRKNICELMDIRPDYANIESNGELVRVEPDEVEAGSIIVVQPGERVPIDGVVIDGESQLDTAALTGESVPRSVVSGDEVISGCINLTGVLKLKTLREFENSTVSKILELVENASSRKSKSEDFIARFARIYTPAVCYCALALAVIPPVLSLAFAGAPTSFAVWFYRALTFLVVSCPCALVISIPLSFFAGIGGASREGILIKGSNFLETLSKTDCVVFDKTGTLTRGSFEVTDICSASDDGKLLEYAALCEIASSHPIAGSIKLCYGKELNRERVSDITELAGKGIQAKIDSHNAAVGNDALMEQLGIKYKKNTASGTVVHVAADGEYLGCIVIADAVKETSEAAIKALKSAGVNQTVMLTGDSTEVAEAVAGELGIDQVHSSLLPADKVLKVEELLNKKSGRGTLAFVGDGINDAPVLSRADIGIAMGAMGSDAAIEAADVVLMDDDPGKIAKAIRISRKCLGIVYQNCILAIGVKLLCLIFTAFGAANMWFAIFADVGVMVIAVLNAIRALNVKNI